MAKAKTEGIVKAAEAAVAPVTPETEAPVAAALPDTPYIFGQPAPDDVVLSLEKGRFVSISPEYLSVKRGFNVRDFSTKENQEAVASMTQDILLNGWLDGSAIGVFLEKDEEDPNLTRIVVYRGETRTRALNEIIAQKGPGAIPTVPVLLMELPDAATVAADFQRSNNGKNLAMLEQYEIIKRLQNEGIKGPSAIGRVMGMTHTAVNNVRILGFATPAMREWIGEGWLAATNVLEDIRALKLNEKSEEDQAVALNGLEKTLKGRVTRLKNVGKGAGSHGQEEEGEPKPPREQDPDDKAFSKATYKALLTTLRDLYANQLTPASQYTKQREAIRSVLLSNGLPIVSQKVEQQAKATAELLKAEAEKPAEAVAS